jgi:hypothetical protein
MKLSDKSPIHRTEVRFAGFLSGGFITAIVVNPPESKLTKRTSVHWQIGHYLNFRSYNYYQIRLHEL